MLTNAAPSTEGRRPQGWTSTAPNLTLQVFKAPRLLVRTESDTRELENNKRKHTSMDVLLNEAARCGEVVCGFGLELDCLGHHQPQMEVTFQSKPYPESTLQSSDAMVAPRSVQCCYDISPLSEPATRLGRRVHVPEVPLSFSAHVRLELCLKVDGKRSGVFNTPIPSPLEPNAPMKFLSSLELKNICRLSDEPDLGNAVGSEIPGPGFSVKLRRARHLVCEERKGAVHLREVRWR
ncbi:hypothetical protein FA13DRAFT_307481 [Coprinellus micaceus]|uniref:Uncharacterized protein n=1 Tax=Coprinellus micaceus TaxID=71717 RepID=A0A4Y7TCA2_COPMI|nr:hypothetical protein FA13DRAFT_307481 [Coprinellus micaceus]